MQKPFNPSAQFIKSFAIYNWVPWSIRLHPLLTMPTQELLPWLLAFKNLCRDAKNQFISSVHSYNTADIRVTRPDRPCPFLNTTTLKLLKKFLAFLNFHQHASNKFISLSLLLLFFFFWDMTNFRVLRPEWPQPVFDHAHPNIFQTTFTFHKSVSTCKKLGFFYHFVLEI